jgi:DNA-binding transcriptional regulator YdaS (Cro superfamily)
VTSDELRQAGRKLFGDRWQTAMARRLRVDPSTVRRWVSGKVRVPNTAEEALKLMIERSAQPKRH